MISWYIYLLRRNTFRLACLWCNIWLTYLKASRRTVYKSSVVASKWFHAPNMPCLSQLIGGLASGFVRAHRGIISGGFWVPHSTLPAFINRSSTDHGFRPRTGGWGKSASISTHRPGKPRWNDRALMIVFSRQAENDSHLLLSHHCTVFRMVRKNDTRHSYSGAISYWICNVQHLHFYVQWTSSTQQAY